MDRRCEHCRTSLPIMARAHARYCSTRCRMAASRQRQRQRAEHPVPAELRAARRWVRYTRAKIPMTPGGRAASVTNPDTWSTFAEVEASTVGVGYGYVLAEGDRIVCVDLDHCVSPDGTVAEWAQDILNQCPQTYVEISPSGTGLHVWGRGHVEKGRRIRRPDGAAIEVYGAGRYITSTGHRYHGAPAALADLTSIAATIAS